MQNHGMIGSKEPIHRETWEPVTARILHMFVCHAGKQSKQSFTFLIRYRSGGTPSNQARTCAGVLRAVARGTRAHQQFWEPPGSSCCSSLLAGEFWQATHSGTPGGTFNNVYINIRRCDGEH